MFSTARTIDRAFKQFRFFTILVILVCALVSLVVVYKSYNLAAGSHNRIYILANGKVLEAYSSDSKDNIAVEIKDHVRVFHHYFFTLDPDEKVIQANVTRALYLADGSAKRQYDNLKENSYYQNIIAGNISQEVIIDSVYVDTGRYPFYFRCYGRQKIIRPTSQVIRSLVTEGQLRNVSRSDNNPHGLLIEKWATLENKDLKTEAR